MDKLQWAQLKSAVKTLDAGPRKIAKAREEYRTADEYMQQHKRIYSQAAQENYYKTAQAKRDSAINAEVAKMQKAIETVRAFHGYPGEAIDLGSVKLQNALNIINALGRKLRPDEQLSIAQQFTGQPAALHFLADLYRQKGYYYADYVDSMAAPINETALENIEYACNSWEGLHKWPEEKLYWTQTAFADAAARLGFDAEETDPYIAALKAARDGQAPDAQRVLSNAIYQIEHAPESGLTDADKVQLFNDATAKAEALVKGAEAREISRQATTQQALDAIREAATADSAIEGGAD